MNNPEQSLSKKERKLLKRQQKEKERQKRINYRKTKRILTLSAIAILIAGGSLAAISFLSGPKNNSNNSQKIFFNKAVGQKAPDFSLQDINGKEVKLSGLLGKNIVLFFNEGAMCYPACWDQIEALANDERFNTNDVVTFSIVADQKSEWETIISQAPQFSQAKILFDSNRSVSAAYDVLSLASSMHPGSFPGHTYVVIDKKGVIRYVFDDPNMGIRNDELTAEIEKLSKSGTGNTP